MSLTHHELRERIARSQAGDKQARQELIESNMRLVWSVVYRFKNRGVDLNDLFQIGCVGLLKAVDQFDLRYEVRFSTYAVPMMMGEMQRYIRDDGSMRVSRSLKELYAKIRKYQDMICGQSGSSPTVRELASALEADEEQIQLALNAFRPVHSMDEPLYVQDGDPLTVKDQLADSSVRPAADQVILREAIRSLNPRERKFVFLRYFQDRTQTEIAGSFGISQVQVSRMEKRILTRLREWHCD